MKESSNPTPNIKKGIMVVTGVKETPKQNKSPYPVKMLNKMQTTAPMPTEHRDSTRFFFQKTKQQKRDMMVKTAGKSGISLTMDRKNSSLKDR